MINKANIYEFDLKQFFPSVNTGWIYRQMFNAKIPKDICNWVFRLNKSQPKLPKDRKLDESTVELATLDAKIATFRRLPDQGGAEAQELLNRRDALVRTLSPGTP